MLYCAVIRCMFGNRGSERSCVPAERRPRCFTLNSGKHRGLLSAGTQLLSEPRLPNMHLITAQYSIVVKMFGNCTPSTASAERKVLVEGALEAKKAWPWKSAP